MTVNITIVVAMIEIVTSMEGITETGVTAVVLLLVADTLRTTEGVAATQGALLEVAAQLAAGNMRRLLQVLSLPPTALPGEVLSLIS